MSKSEQFTQVVQEWAEVFMRRSMRDFIRFAKETGLTIPQISSLMRLYYRGACGISDIGSHLDVTTAAASQMVDKLVQQGVLERMQDPSDRRARQVTLTRRGRALIEKGLQARRRWLEDLTGALSPAQQAEIVSALTFLTEAAKKTEPPES